MTVRQQIQVILVVMCLLGTSFYDSLKSASPSHRPHDQQHEVACAIEDGETRVELETGLDCADGLDLLAVEPRQTLGTVGRLIQDGVEASQLLFAGGPDLSRAPPARA
jgi:hypothetical protein